VREVCTLLNALVFAFIALRLFAGRNYGAYEGNCGSSERSPSHAGVEGRLSEFAMNN